MEMNKEISENYCLDIKSILPYKDDFILATSEGKKILKRTACPSERIIFIHEAKEHLIKNNFNCIDRYICTQEGLPFLNIEGNCYTLADFIEGSECNFGNREDIIRAAALLANFHRAAKGFLASPESIIKDELGMIPTYFSRRLGEIKKLKKFAKRRKSKFDYLFLETVDYFYDLGESTIQAFPESGYDELVKKSRNEGILCHHDFTHHNIICSSDETYLINFEYCCYELKIYDIANFIRRKMRKCNWDIDEGRVIFNEYRKIEPIGDSEFAVMKLMLLFPQKFWRVVNKYYNSKRGWSERSFVEKLQEVIDEIKVHKKFMDQYDSILL